MKKTVLLTWLTASSLLLASAMAEENPKTDRQTTWADQHFRTLRDLSRIQPFSEEHHQPCVTHVNVQSLFSRGPSAPGGQTFRVLKGRCTPT